VLQDVRMALDATRTAVIHELPCKVDVCLVEVNHIVRGLQVTIFAIYNIQISVQHIIIGR
jgi:hypothetical protein